MSSGLAKNRKETEVADPNRWGVNTARAGTAERQAISPLGDGWKPRVAPHYQAKVSEPERARGVGRVEGGGEVRKEEGNGSRGWHQERTVNQRSSRVSCQTP